MHLEQSFAEQRYASCQLMCDSNEKTFPANETNESQHCDISITTSPLVHLPVAIKRVFTKHIYKRMMLTNAIRRF